MPGSISGYDRDIYRLLRRTLCQCVAVPEIVDFHVLDVITVCNIDFSIEFRRRHLLLGRRLGGSRRTSILRERREKRSMYKLRTSIHTHIIYGRKLPLPYIALRGRGNLLQSLPFLDLSFDFGRSGSC